MRHVLQALGKHVSRHLQVFSKPSFQWSPNLLIRDDKSQQNHVLFASFHEASMIFMGDRDATNAF